MPFLPSRIPLIQAPMAGAQGVALAVAVCKAGGLGSLPAAMLTPDRLREQIAMARDATSAPFNVNFFCHSEPVVNPEIEARWRNRLAPYYAEAGVDLSAVTAGPARAPFGEALCATIEETRPAVVSFHFGLPPSALLSRVKATGALVLSSATTVAEARWLEQNGADAIIAQGREAGGHRAMFLNDDIDAQPGLIALLPQVRDAVRVPVVAAGGITDGRAIAAAFALGADAVQIGTAYLRSPEAMTSPLHRAALANARDDATRLTNVFTGRPARGLVNRFVAEVGPMCEDAPQFPLAAGAAAPLRTAGEKRGSSDFSPLWAGEAAALAREDGAEALTRKLWADGQAVIAALMRARIAG
jgi:nitronate monooxygenase